MELRHLRYFAAVAEHGNFNRAAENLHLTQPALSRQVRDLEEEIGVTLFIRGKQATTLTPAGEIFYEEARDLLARADRAIQRTRGEIAGEILRVGYASSLTAGVLPRAISRFHAERPRVRLELLDLPDQEILGQLTAGQLDLGVTAIGAGVGARGLQWIELFKVSPVLILPLTHPLARLKRIPPTRLRDVPLVGLSRATNPEYTRLVRTILRPHGVTPQIVTQADGIASLFNALAAQGFAAILPSGVEGLLPASLALRPFAPALAETVVGAATLLAKSNPHAELFVRLLREPR